MKILKHLYHHYRTKKIIKQNLFTREKYNDRNVLEQIIIPYILAYFNPKTILDIGREDYQKFYNEFFTGRELWTMDIDPEKAEFGSSNHIIDSCTEVKKHFEDNKFDFVILNGVLGWGLNKPGAIEKAITDIHNIMRPGGILVIGWNNFEDIEVIKPKNIKAIKKFKPYTLKPLKSSAFECVNGFHTYNFYIK